MSTFGYIAGLKVQQRVQFISQWTIYCPSLYQQIHKLQVYTWTWEVELILAGSGTKFIKEIEGTF